MYRVDYDRRANRLSIHVSGFWSPDEVAALAAAVGAKANEARAVRDDFDTIVESFDFPVQATDVAALLSQIAQAGLRLTTGRAAIVVGSALNKLQAERTLAHPRLRVFGTIEDAEAWLAAPR